MCDGVLLVSVTPCPLIYSVYTLLCTVTGGRADRRPPRRAPPPPPPAARRRPRRAAALLSSVFSPRSRVCGCESEGSTSRDGSSACFGKLTHDQNALSPLATWRSAPSLHAHLRDRVAHPERHAAKIMGRARTICYRRKQLACSNRVPIVARRSKCGAGGPSASTLAGKRSHRPAPPCQSTASLLRTSHYATMPLALVRARHT